MADCVVVGGGLAGMVSARRMQQLGLRPVVLEKGDADGGLCNARISGGLVHLAWCALDEGPGVLRRRLVEETDGEILPELADVLASNAERAISWLHAEGVETRPKSEVNYQKHTLYPPRPGTGRRIGPEYGPDRMMTRLYRNFRAEPGTIRLGAAASGLARDGGKGPWAVRYTADGTVREETAQAVLVADGGFQANREMLTRYVGPNAGLALLRAMPSATGDGLRMLLDNGAAAAGLGRVYGHMVAYDALTNDTLWPYPAMDKLCLTGALVDRQGELVRHRATTGVELVTLLSRGEDPRGHAIVFDQALWTTSGRDNPYNSAVPNPDLPDRGGHLVTGDTLDKLAAELGADPDRLVAAVDEHNRAGTRPPVRDAPFYAAKVVPGITFTMGGAEVDAAARVVDRAGQPIPGVYAAGSTVGGVHGGAHGGYAGGLAVALELGLVAAESVAAQLRGDGSSDAKGA